MIYQRNKAPDFNWVTLFAGGGDPVEAKKHGFKATRATQKVMRYGSNKAVARTIGTSVVEDTALEFDWMGAIKFLGNLGITDYNVLQVPLAGKTFEMVEGIRDPETNLFKSAGGVTNVAKGCEIVGVEWNHEAGENASPLTITVSILDLDIAKGDKGGAGMNLGTG
jgi:hypothetical protein